MVRRNPQTTSDALGHIRELLEQCRVQEALGLIMRFGTRNAEVINAYGVCLMRAGELDRAVEVYQSACLSGSVCLKQNVSTLHVANYATALLLKGNVSGCQDLLARVPDRSHPAVRRVREAIQRWRQSLSWSQRLRLALSGRAPAKSPALVCPSGMLDDIGTT